MGTVFGEAFKRGLYVASVAAGSAFFGALATTDDVRAAAIVAGAAFFGALAMRGGGEGLYDQHRADTGRVIASDVPMASTKLDVVQR